MNQPSRIGTNDCRDVPGGEWGCETCAIRETVQNERAGRIAALQHLSAFNHATWSRKTDWTPVELHLTENAAQIIHAWRDGQPTHLYNGLMLGWTTLTGLDEPEALTYAFQIATLNPPTTTAVPPF